MEENKPKRPEGVNRVRRKIKKQKELMSEDEQVKMRLKEKAEKTKKKKEEVKMKKENKSNKIGAEFEARLVKLFKRLRKKSEAYILKIPTEMVLIRNGGKIVNGYPKKKSDCLDFIGFLPDGRAFILESKTYNAKGKERKDGIIPIKPFPFANIQDYQYALVEELYNYNLNVFYLIQARISATSSEIFLIKGSAVREYKDLTTRHSIPFEDFDKIGIRLEEDLSNLLDKIKEEMVLNED